MIQFKTQDPIKTEVEGWSRQHTPSLECLEKMLKEWRLRMSNGAKLRTFIEYLRNCNLNSLADVLQNKFWPDSTPTDGQEEGLLPKREIECHPYPPKKVNRTELFFLLSYLLIILAVSIIILILANIVISNIILPNRKADSLLPEQVQFVPKSNETTSDIEDYLTRFGATSDESTSLPDRVDKVGQYEQTQFQLKNQTKVVVTDSDVLNDIFIPQPDQVNLISLEFNNSLGQICEKTHDEASDDEIVLPELQELIIDVTKDCETLVDRILNNIVVNNIKFLRIKGYITNAFIQQIHEFIHRYYRTLQEIHILGVLEGTNNVFEIRNTIFLNSVKVVTVKLDRIWNATVHQNIINYRFCSIFPEIIRLETKNVLISYNELLKLQNCSKLEEINTTVRINGDNVGHLEEFNWQEKFQTFKYIAINLQFDTCPDRMFFEKLIKKFDMFEKYKLCSNCNMCPTWRTIHCMEKSKPS